MIDLISYTNERGLFEVEKGVEYRNESPIFHLKAFNNWLKSVLIQRYCREGNVVLDLAGGKGGDLLKFVKVKVKHVVLAGIL